MAVSNCTALRSKSSLEISVWRKWAITLHIFLSVVQNMKVILHSLPLVLINLFEMHQNLDHCFNNFLTLLHTCASKENDFKCFLFTQYRD